MSLSGERATPRVRERTGKTAETMDLPFDPKRVGEGAVSRYGEGESPRLTFKSGDQALLYHGDCLALLSQVASEYPNGVFDVIFADPPYFLSNGGITCHAGRMVSVDKGQWDRSRGVDADHEFNTMWLAACRDALKPNGTLWVSGTSHVIYSIGFAMQRLGLKLLNDIAWVKPNPPPNLACRYFTHATETILWAAKNAKSRHTFNYEDMKRFANGKQMKNVWELPAPATDEKVRGKHPTQKPVRLIERILLASTEPNALAFDPFMGSGTTGVAAVRTGRRFVGIDVEKQYVELAQQRLKDAIAAPSFFAQD